MVPEVKMISSVSLRESDGEGNGEESCRAVTSKSDSKEMDEIVAHSWCTRDRKMSFAFTSLATRQANSNGEA